MNTVLSYCFKKECSQQKKEGITYFFFSLVSQNAFPFYLLPVIDNDDFDNASNVPKCVRDSYVVTSRIYLRNFTYAHLGNIILVKYDNLALQFVHQIHIRLVKTAVKKVLYEVHSVTYLKRLYA